MKTLYFDLPMGAAGDMLGAALYELLNEDEKKAFLQQLCQAGIPGVEVSAEKSVKCGITGTHLKVRENGEEEDLQKKASGGVFSSFHNRFCLFLLQDTEYAGAVQIFARSEFEFFC